MRRPSSPLAVSAVLASVAASGLRRSSSSSYGIGGIGSGGGAGVGSAAGLAAASATVGAGGGSILGNMRSGSGAIPVATPQVLQVCSPHGMHAIPCRVPCMHAQGPAGVFPACNVYCPMHASMRTCPRPCRCARRMPCMPRRACMHAPSLHACMVPTASPAVLLYCTGWFQLPRIGGRLVADAAAAVPSHSHPNVYCHVLPVLHRVASTAACRWAARRQCSSCGGTPRLGPARISRAACGSWRVSAQGGGGGREDFEGCMRQLESECV